MKLIADSGSTKTDWVLIRDNAVVGRYQTQGINPFHQSEDDILNILRSELLTQLSPSTIHHPLSTIHHPLSTIHHPLSTIHHQLSTIHHPPLTIHYYGSGVRPELEEVMQRLLLSAFPSATFVEAHGDLLGAARAVVGSQEGIACILGTGANSCLYDGRQITQNTPPLGYILGDEGSGAVLGKRFLNALYKGFVPASLVAGFQEDIGMDMSAVIARIYREPMANRFLASLSPFISRHIDVPEVRQLVVDNFCDFFRRNVVQYARRDLPVGFVGSIAWHYEDQLRKAASQEGFIVGRVLKSPIDGLVAYHTEFP